MSLADVNSGLYIYPFFILNKIRGNGKYLTSKIGVVREIYKRRFFMTVRRIFDYETLLYRIFATIEFFTNFSVYIGFNNREMI